MDNDIEELRERAISAARSKIKQVYESDEYPIMQAINTYMEMNKYYNMLYERLSEWFGIYFPELNNISQGIFPEIAAFLLNNPLPQLSDIEDITKDHSLALEIESKSKLAAARTPASSDEKETVLEMLDMEKRIRSSLSSLEKYIESAAKRLMPNASSLVGSMIIAELLSKAGSFSKLANMPASGIQLLGAEKALFKHIKFGSKPPKYGILFKLPDITNAPRDSKGRIARAYAAKLSIALKADYYSKSNISEILKEQLSSSLRKIKQKESIPKPARQPSSGNNFKNRNYNNPSVHANYAGKQRWENHGFRKDQGKRQRNAQTHPKKWQRQE
ncbi:MAG: hypothetical protein ACP5RP_00905 [Candidatus Micrarchaeia archaeon]